MLRGLLILTLASATMPRVVHADRKAGDPDRASQAKTLIERGTQLYQEKKYLEAVAQFEAAYKLSWDPDLLFNIAQAYRLNDSCAAARAYYERFLQEAPKSDKARAVRHRIAQMTACVDTRPAEPTPPMPPPPNSNDPQVVPAPSPPAPAPSTPAPAPSRSTTVIEQRGGPMRTAGIVTFGLGIAITGVGVYFAIDASRAQSKVDELFTTTTGVWDARYQKLQERGERSALLARGFVIGGGVAIAAGAAMYLMGRGSERVVVTPQGQGGAAIAWRGSF